MDAKAPILDLEAHVTMMWSASCSGCALISPYDTQEPMLDGKAEGALGITSNKLVIY